MVSVLLGKISLNKISIGFSKRNNNLISWLIRKIDNVDYSHVYIRRNSKYGEYVYQASGLEVNFTNIKTFLDHNQIVEEYEFELTDEQLDKLLIFCIKHVGKPYNMKDLFLIAANILTKKLNINLGLKGDGDETFKCSELGAMLVQDILNIEIAENEDFITPSELNPYIKDHGKQIF